ncbi:hypothetical protein OG742_10315 [Streptomyces sp. NBC_00828]|uniref:three-helix bundle dimerization domain-containing protein n=1 Tax=Streptomyces sp. NBC_00828 TaxID=2903678 RepID=UPI00386C8FEA
MLIEPDEDVAIQRVTDCLRTRCSDGHAPDEIETAVATAYATFDTLPIRTYVPVLVERQARRILNEHSG